MAREMMNVIYGVVRQCCTIKPFEKNNMMCIILTMEGLDQVEKEDNLITVGSERWNGQAPEVVPTCICKCSQQPLTYVLWEYVLWPHWSSSSMHPEPQPQAQQHLELIMHTSNERKRSPKPYLQEEQQSSSNCCPQVAEMTQQVLKCSMPP